ncbi:MAG: hypothetical protein IJZ44_08155 [Lachnospiraceae bacterium]|nr:hypothetical protein [Lachnospiraceae bacterium]
MMSIQETIADLFAYEEMGNCRFSKDTYEPSFEKFGEIAENFDSLLNQLYEADGDVMCENVAQAFVDYIVLSEEAGLSKLEADEKQRSHNVFMATYVLPHILEMRNPYYKELAKAIEKKWGASFKNSKIKAATFETVMGGFQKKFLGFSL